MRGTVLLLAAALGGCGAAGNQCLLPDETRQVRIMLYFGLDRPDGGHVTAAQWRDFVDRVVTPRFADGLTEIEAGGQWRDRSTNRIGREPSRILLLLAPPSADLAQRVEAIRTHYKAAFVQQSVGVSSEPVCTGF